jgi:acyl-CoA thioester hydrolase
MHTTTVRVRYAETDKAGVVYHANYLHWFEVGRTELLRELGAPYALFERDSGLFLTVTEALIRYRQPARYDDVVEIGTWITDLRRVRFRLDHQLRREGSDEVLCTGHIVLACVRADGRPTPIPEELAGLLDRMNL